MSAIAGVFHFDRSVEALTSLYATLAAMRERGPDGCVVWNDDTAALGHLLLSTGAGQGSTHQIARSASGRVCTADIRLDNRAELLTALGCAARAGMTDAEIVLLAYDRWDTACVTRLVGDFAFVIWDPTARVAFCARDPMGVRALYLSRSGEFLAVATEVRGLLAQQGIPDDPDEGRIRRHLAWEDDERESTFYSAIRRLPPAHWLRVSPSGATRSRYWTPADAADVRLASDVDYADGFRDHFVRAVASRLPAGAPVAASLSGGLDSSSIVCLARHDARVAPDRLHALSVVFPGMSGAELKRIDEREFMDAVVAEGGFTSHRVRGDTVSPLAEAETLVGGLAEPYAAPNLFLHRAMYEKARKTGARVFLDGFDGDSTVSHGLNRLDDLLGAGRWDIYEGEVRSFARHRAISPAAVVQEYGLPHLGRAYRNRQWGSWITAGAQLHRRFGISRWDLFWKYSLRSAPSATPGSTREEHARGLDQPLYQSTLELADRTAALSGLEPRYPFFDRRLIEYCLGLPADQKLSGGWTRIVFRRAMEGVLPPAVQWRSTKANLSPAFDLGFRERDRAAVAAADLSLLDGYADVTRLTNIRRRVFVEQLDVPRAEAFLLFRAATLAVWLQQHSVGAWRHADTGQQEVNRTRVAVLG